MSDKKWNHINSELKNALDTWTELTEQLTNQLSPEEKQLQEIKSILGVLKDKLQEFNELPDGLSEADIQPAKSKSDSDSQV